jgi:demethylmenaquinone methyltransferase/2-methoxy-6-polyprenyl-1,4-benzoquinol methylase
MLRVCRRRLLRNRQHSSIGLIQGDGLRLPFRAGAFDIVLMSFTLELFAEDEMPQVLQEAARVLRREGRLGIACLSSRHPGELATRAYWRVHRALPAIVDCRPIDAPALLGAHGYELTEEAERSMWGLRVAILVGRKGSRMTARERKDGYHRQPSHARGKPVT